MSDAEETSGFTIRLPENGWGDLDDRAQRNRAAIRTMFVGMAAGDLGALTALLAPDIHFVQAPGLPYAVDAHGVEEAMAGLGQMMAAWSRLDVQLIDVFASGDRVFAFLQMDGVSASGKTYSGPVTELFRFDGDKVVEWRPIYWDTFAVRTACGG